MTAATDACMSMDALRLLLKEQDKSLVHCMGIGGVGMAGLAALLKARGFRVTGCDGQRNRLTATLEQDGISVLCGHDPSHLDEQPRLLVRSTAVSLDQPEIAAARAKGIPVYRRGEVFPALLYDVPTVAVSGTHGKTTTTAMCAHAIRSAAGAMPSFFVGGEWEKAGRVFGQGPYPVTVVEADESDGTLVHYAPDWGVVTGIDFDHMEHFADETAFVRVFETFMRRTRCAIVYCHDDPRLGALIPAGKPSLSYGLGAGALFRGVSLDEDEHGISFSLEQEGVDMGRFRVPVPGRHHVQNALAALAVTTALGLPVQVAGEALANFRPVKRRFEFVGRWRGQVPVYSDYAHHPTEIRALLSAARRLKARRVLAIFQPHRYTRTRALGSQFPPAFSDADTVILAPIYPASEQPVPGGCDADLTAHFRAYGTRAFEQASSLEEAWHCFEQRAEPGDVLFLIGAGDVEQLAEHVREISAE